VLDNCEHLIAATAELADVLLARILIGTNDVRNGVPLDRYRANLHAIIDHLKARTTARIALMSLLGRSWDEIAHAGGRELLVEHVHLNDRGGTIIADLVSQWLINRS
jgi:hypothetical protein